MLNKAGANRAGPSRRVGHTSAKEETKATPAATEMNTAQAVAENTAQAVAENTAQAVARYTSTRGEE